MPAKVGSGDQFFPSIWANAVRKASSGDAINTNVRPALIVGPLSNLFVVHRTFGSSWSNSQSRVVVYEFDIQTGSLNDAVSVGSSGDSFDYGPGNSSYGFFHACLTNGNNLLVSGMDAGATVKVADLNSSLSKFREVDTGTNMGMTAVCSNNANDIMVIYQDSNYVEILDDTSSWAATVDGGTFNGITRAQHCQADGANFYVCGQVTVGSVDHACIEKYDGTGASTASIRWYDPAYASANDKHIARCMTIDSSGNVYVAWTGYDSSATQYLAYVSKLNSSLALQWTKRIGDLGSFHGYPTICMAPDETGVITCWHNGSTGRINQLNSSTGAEEVDLAITSTGNFSRGNIEAMCVASDSSNVYLCSQQPASDGDLEILNVMAISQTDFESWTTEQYNEFDGDGTYGWGNTSITPTTGTLSSTGIGGTGGSPAAETALDVDSETVSEDRDTY